MKNFIAIITCCSILCIATLCQATESSPTPDSLFEQANLSAISGEYEQAITLYQHVAKAEGVSAPLFYNLANCYAKTDKTGEAVANYERALRLDPGNEDIKANLAQVRKDTGLYRDDSPLYERLASILGADQWLLLAGTAFFFLSVILLLANVQTSLSLPLIKGLSFTCLIIILITLPPAIFQYQSWNDGVVTGKENRLLISPFSGAESTGTIKTGRLIRIKKHHGNYVLVEDATGRTGWLKQESYISLSEPKELH